MTSGVVVVPLLLFASMWGSAWARPGVPEWLRAPFVGAEARKHEETLLVSMPSQLPSSLQDAITVDGERVLLRTPTQLELQLTGAELELELCNSRGCQGDFALCYASSQPKHPFACPNDACGIPFAFPAGNSFKFYEEDGFLRRDDCISVKVAEGSIRLADFVVREACPLAAGGVVSVNVSALPSGCAFSILGARVRVTERTQTAMAPASIAVIVVLVLVAVLLISCVTVSVVVCLKRRSRRRPRPSPSSRLAVTRGSKKLPAPPPPHSPSLQRAGRKSRNGSRPRPPSSPRL